MFSEISKFRQARLTVLSTVVQGEVRPRAMALEAAGRSADRLIIDTRDNVEAARIAATRWRKTELYCWRAAAAIGAALLVMAKIDPIVAWIDAATGVVKPAALVFQGIFGLGCAVVAFAAVRLVLELIKLHKGFEMPRVERAAELFIPLVAGLAGAILHQG